MNFNFDTGTIDTIQTLDCTQLPPLGGTAGVLTIIGTGAITLPKGSTAQEPVSAVAGMFRYNTDIDQLEYFDGTSWQQLTSTAGTVSSFQTSLSGLTPSTATTGAITLAGTLGVASGGTGDTSFTTNGILYGNSTSSIQVTAAGTQYQVLNAGAGGVPVFDAVHLDQAAAVTGILGLSHGGTNSALTGSNGSIIYNNGSALVNSTVGTLGQVLTSAGAGAPTWTTASSTVTTNQIVQGDGAGAFTANGATFVGSGSFSGVTLNGTVTNATDATTKQYVDSVTAGLSWKQAVRARSAADLGTVTYNNGASGVGATITNAGTQAALVLDGYTVVTGDRVLIGNESNAAYNGIYTVTNTGSVSTNFVLTRATDNNTSAKMDGAAVFVEQGTTYADTAFVQVTDQPIVIGTTNLVWTQFSGSGTYTAGAGLNLTGTQFNVKVDSSTTYIDGGNNVAVLSSATIGQVLLSAGAGNTATWGAVNLANNNAVTGVLGVTNGGTGSSATPSNGQLLIGNGSTYTTASVTTGTGISVTVGAGTLQINNTGVTSLIAGTGINVSAATGAVTVSNTGVLSFSLNDSSTTPIYVTTPTTSTTGAVGATITLATQTANKVFAGPTSGGATQPTFRTLVYADVVGTGNAIQLYAENASSPVVPTATGSNAQAFGSGASQGIFGGKAYANGDFATAGDAQEGLYVLRNITTNNTATDLFLDGTGVSQRLVVNNNSVWTFDILVAARRTDAVGGGAGYRFVGVVRKDATSASTTLVGAVSKTVIGETDGAWDANCTANTTNGDLRVTVTGQNAKTIRWVATVRTTEVTN